MPNIWTLSTLQASLEQAQQNACPCDLSEIRGALEKYLGTENGMRQTHNRSLTDVSSYVTPIVEWLLMSYQHELKTKLEPDSADAFRCSVYRVLRSQGRITDEEHDQLHTIFWLKKLATFISPEASLVRSACHTAMIKLCILSEELGRGWRERTGVVCSTEAKLALDMGSQVKQLLVELVAVAGATGHPATMFSKEILRAMNEFGMIDDAVDSLILMMKFSSRGPVQDVPR